MERLDAYRKRAKGLYDKVYAAIHVISHGCSHVRPKFSSGVGFTGESHGNRQSAKNCKGLCSEFPNVNTPEVLLAFLGHIL